jgi:hypothetical protein
MSTKMKIALGLVAVGGLGYWLYTRSEGGAMLGGPGQTGMRGLGGLGAPKRLSSLDDAHPSRYFLEV